MSASFELHQSCLLITESYIYISNVLHKLIKQKTKNNQTVVLKNYLNLKITFSSCFIML